MKITENDIRRVIREELESAHADDSIVRPITQADIKFKLQRHTRLMQGMIDSGAYDKYDIGGSFAGPLGHLTGMTVIDMPGQPVISSIDVCSDDGVQKVLCAKGEDGTVLVKGDGIPKRPHPPVTESEINEIALHLFESMIAEAPAGKKKGPSPHPAQYKAKEGSPRDKKLDSIRSRLASADTGAERKKVFKDAAEEREQMEKQAREKPGWKNKPRKDTVDEALVQQAAIIIEELSKKLKATLRKKAQKRGLTPGSVESEYKKGLAAYVTSGSRPGMTSHQWSMARVNAASPSKKWATVKKSKGKKKE